jgi:MFS family permease
VISVTQIFVLSICLGIVNAFDMPGRQSFLIDMVENREDLGNAIALNSALVNAARLLGPSIAGLLIAAVGEGICFLLNAVSYIAVITALWCMHIAPRPILAKSRAIVAEFREGFAYAFAAVPIRSILLLLALVSLAGMPYSTLLPIFAQNILHGGPLTLGFLMGAAGVGALGGAFYLAARPSIRGLQRLIGVAAAIFGAGLMAFSLSRIFWVSLVLMVLVGFGMMVQMASSNTVLQMTVDDDKRGRVMSLYTMALMGMVPFGHLLAGILASKIGAPRTLLIGGLSCMVGVLIFATTLSAFKELEDKDSSDVVRR